jgi:hypothetical protein
MGELLKTSLALSAFVLSLFSIWRSVRSERLTTFMNLHGRFQTIFQDLPADYATRDWADWSDAQKLVARQYWHNARAEWLASTKWVGFQRSLWKDHYGPVQVSGSEHPGLLAALIEVVGVDGAVKSKLWTEYLADLNSVRTDAGLPLIKPT